MKNKFSNQYKNVLIIKGTQGMAQLSLAVVSSLHIVKRITVCRLFSSNGPRQGLNPRARCSSLAGGCSAAVRLAQQAIANLNPRARRSSSPWSAVRLLLSVILLSLLLPMVAVVLPAGQVREKLAPTVDAATNTLNFQGRLLQSSGSLVPDGIYNMQFDLYNVASGGSSLWTEDRLVANTQGVTVQDGYYSVYLGEYDAFPVLDWSQDLYLGMTVRGTTSCVWGSCSPTDGEMTPRFKLTSVPYAFRASNVASSSTNAASTNSDAVSITTGNALGATSNSGNITVDVGTATGTAGTISLGATNASALTLGRNGITTTNAGALTVSQLLTASSGLTVTGTLTANDNVTLGSSTADTLTVEANATFNGSLVVSTGDQFTNAGSTLFTAVAISDVSGGGNIGSAATTVDVATTFNVNQTTAGQTLTLPNPTVTTSGRIAFVNNVGSASFTMYGNPIATGKAASFIWNGSSWVQTISFTSTGVDTLGAIGSSPNANGATITGTTLTLQPADASFGGVVTTGSQTFAGAKTFTDATTVTGPSGGSDTALTVNTGAATNVGLRLNGASSQTANFLEIRGFGESYNSFEVKNDGETIIRPVTGGDGIVLRIQNAGGSTTPFYVDTSTGYTHTYGQIINGLIQHTGSTQYQVGGTNATFTSPQSASISAKMVFDLYNPGNSNQVIALGLPSGAETNSRGISLFDNRAAGDNQPVLSVFSPDESDVFGLSSDGSNSYGYLKATSGLGLGIKSGTTIAATFETSGDANLNYDLSVDGTSVLGANQTLAAWGTSGVQLQTTGSTYTDSSTAGSGTATNAVFNSFTTPTLAASNSSVTTTNAATVYIQGAPTAGTNQTITNPYAFWVDGGLTRLDGNLVMGDAEMGNAGFLAEFQGTTTASIAVTAGDASSSSVIYLGTEGNETGQGALSYDNNTDIYYITANGGSGTVTLDANSTFTVGTGAATGELRLADGSSNYVTFNVNALAGDYTLSVPTITANDTLCVVTLGNCSAAGREFTAVVGTSVDSSNVSSASYVADGTSDEDEINAAITAVNSAGGGKVLLLEGTYTIDGTIDIKSDVELIGSGVDATEIKFGNGTNLSTFVITESTNPTNFTIRDLSINANDSNNTGTQGGIALLTVGSNSGATSARGGLIENVEIYDLSDNGIYLDDADFTTVRKTHIYDTTTYGMWIDSGDTSRSVLIEGNNIHDAGNHGISAIDAPGLIIDGNTVSNNGTNGVYVESSNGAVISNNVTNSNSYGIRTNGGQVTVTGNVSKANGVGIQVDEAGWANVSGNNVDGSTGAAGIGVSEGYYLTVNNNMVYNSTNEGILVTGTPGNDQISVSGNKISTTGGRAILLNADTVDALIQGNSIDAVGEDGIETNGADETLISGNSITTVGTSVAGSSSILISGDSNNSSVVGNKLNDAAGSGYAIDIAAAADNTYLADNIYGGTGAASIRDLGTNTRFANQISSASVLQSNSMAITSIANTVLTGSIDPTASTSVTGVSTLFTRELQVGDKITVTGQTRTVVTITNDTSLTVDTAFSDNANDTSVDRIPAGLTVKTTDSSANALYIADSSNATVLNISTANSGSANNSMVFRGIGVFGNSGEVDVAYNGGAEIRIGNNFYGDDYWTGGTGGFTYTFTPVAYTSGSASTFAGLTMTQNFAPTSGTNVYSGIASTPTINQTGGAAGITRGLYVAPTLTAFNDFRGIQVDATSSYATANNQQGAQITVTDTGAVASGTDTTLGASINVTRTGASGGTINNTGINISLTGDTGGTSTNTGLNVSVTGADTNYAAIFQGGNVGIGDASPAALLTVGSSDAFQVDNSGNITTSGDLTVNGDDITADGDLTITPAGGDTIVTGTLAVTSLGSADTSTYLCRNSSNQLATCSSTPLTNSLTDNVTDAFDLQEGTNNYININTTNSLENISFGNATTNPSYSFLGSGTLTVTGDLAANGDDLTTTQTTFNLLDATATDINFGGDATTITLGAADGLFRVNSDEILLGFNGAASILGAGSAGLTVGTDLGATTGNLIFSTGNASGGASGNITLDTGTATTTTGTISIGTANASAITIGRSGLTTTNAGNLLVQGGSATLGVSSSANGSLVLLNATNAFGVTLNAANQTAQSTVISFPDAGANATDTVCLFTLGNCAGAGREFTAVVGTSSSAGGNASSNISAAGYVADGDGGGAGNGDQIEINSAITAVNAAGGGTVYLLEGTYVIDATITLADNVKIVGAGQDATVIQLRSSHNSTVGLFTASSGVEDWEIRDLSINGNDAGQSSGTYYGVSVTGTGGATTKGGTINNVEFYNFEDTNSVGVNLDTVLNVQITNSYFHDVYYGVYGLAAGTSVNMDISNNKFIGLTYAGVALDTITDVTVEGNSFIISSSANSSITLDNAVGITISSNSFGGYDSAPGVVGQNTGVTEVAITGNSFEQQSASGVQGIFSNSLITGNSFQEIGNDGGTNYPAIRVTSTTNTTISGNSIYSPTGDGIQLDSVSGSNLYNTISGNTIEGADNGIMLETGSDYNVISSNTIFDNNNVGISLNVSDNNIISDNIVHDNGNNGSDDGIALVGDSNDNQLIGNRITDTGSGTGQAIDISATSDNTYLADNTYSGTGASTINDAGVGTIYANQYASATELRVVAPTTQTLTLDTGTTGTVNLGTGTSGKTINIGTGAAAANTIALGGTGANVINIGNTQTGGSINLGAAMTSGTITIGGTGAQSGTIALGTGTGAQAINLGTGGTGAKTVTLGSTASTGLTTIQAGTSGVLVKPANGTTAFSVQNASSASLFTVDTTNNVLSLLGNNSGEPQAWAANANTIPAHDNTDNAVIYNGYIYVAGGDDHSSVYSSVAYAKLNAGGTTQAWSTTGTLSTAVTYTNSIEANGYLYVLGGATNVASTNVQSIVQYAKINADGTLGTFTTTSSLPAGRKNGAVLTLNGYMYYIGGDSSSTGTPANTKTVYYAKINADGTLGTWANVSNSNAGYVAGSGTYGQSAVAANGYIYVVGGLGTPDIYYARPGSNGDITSNFTLEATNALPGASGAYDQGVHYANGYLYNVGGTNSSTAQSTVYYAPLNANGSVGTWVQQNTANDLPAARTTFASGSSNGYFYAIGGWNGGAALTTVYYTSLQRIKAGGNLDLGAYSADGVTDPNGAGSLTAGNTLLVGTLTVQDAATFNDNVNVNGNLSVGNGNIAFAAGAARTISVGTRPDAGTGYNLTLQAGTASSGAGGNLVLSGGTGSTVKGLVVIDTATYDTATTQSSATSVGITQANVDSFGAIRLSATATGVTFTLPDPTTTTAGRVVYVTNIGSNDFTLSVNGGGTGNTITLKPNTTATMYWNGVDWTAAGASSSTDLQAAYNNTATSAGGAEIVLSSTGTGGLTVRNDATTAITGGLLEVQTSIGSNLFTVNNNATEYANNGGAESSTFTMWADASTGALETTARDTTAANVATGQGSVSVITTGVATQGVKNTLTTALTNSLEYQVSFTIKAASTGFSALDVMYSYDGSVGNVRHCVAGTPYYATGTASQSGTTITGSGTTFTSAMVGMTFVFADGRSTVITGYSSATSLTAAVSQTVSSQNYGIYTAGFTVNASTWTRVTCNFTAAPSGTTITSSNAIFIRQTDTTTRTFYVDNLSVTVSADVNHAADGSVDSALGTNWTQYDADGGAGTTTVARDTTTIYDTSGSVSDITTAHANLGVRNNMTITPTVSTQYLVTFYARSSNTFNDITVGFLPAGGNSTPVAAQLCADYNTQSVSTTGWTRITCVITTPSSGISDPDLVIYQPTATARTFYIDALTITLNTNNSSNVQIGGGNKGGPTTLFTLDRSNGAPIAANNDAYLGSMYYDTITGRIQCYEADGWGACGAAPDNIVNLNPEYAGAVLNGTGVGTMTADFCSNQAGVLSVNSTLCGSGEAKNYYRWTSPQATQQTYSIYVTYQLPATFNGFSSDDTVQLVARADSTSNAAVTYEMYKSTGSVVTQCGSGETTVVTSANTWQSVGISGNEATGCSFNSSSASNFIIFKINMKANSNANAYVSTLSFTTTGR